SAWFSREDVQKGTLAAGKLADLSVLSDDYFSVPEDQIRSIQSVLTVVGGKIVYCAGSFRSYDPPAPPVLPDWSPVVNSAAATHHAAGGKNPRDVQFPAHASCCNHTPLGGDALLGGCPCALF